MKLLSYNLWFDHYKKIERLESLLATILEVDPDVVCFQEVTPYILELLKNNLVSYENMYPKELSGNYGCVTFSKLPFTKCFTLDFNGITRMGRELLVTFLNEGKDKNICIGNTHFESEFSAENINKLSQFKHSKEFLDKIALQMNRVVLCCDSNISCDKEEKEFFKDWKDCWIVKGNNENKYTYDHETNVNLKKRKIKFRSRIDRIMIKGKLEVKEFKLVKNIKGLIPPSDHHGVFVYLDV